MDFVQRFINAVIEVHPWHVPTVHFPIALTGAGLLLVLLTLWRRSDTLERAAFCNIALAAVSTILAGVTGIRDNLTRFDGDAPMAGVKITLALILFGLTTATAIIRWRKPGWLWQRGVGLIYVAAFAVSFLLTLALGFIGGVILYGF